MAAMLFGSYLLHNGCALTDKLSMGCSVELRVPLLDHVLVETVFDWPGLGLYATKAIVSQDMMPVIGVALVIGLLFVIANLIIDILYGVINPKVRYS